MDKEVFCVYCQENEEKMLVRTYPIDIGKKAKQWFGSSGPFIARLATPGEIERWMRVSSKQTVPIKQGIKHSR